MIFTWIDAPPNGTALGWDIYPPSVGELLAAGYVVGGNGIPWRRIDYG